MNRAAFLSLAATGVAANVIGPGSRAMAAAPSEGRKPSDPLAGKFAIVAKAPPAADGNHTFFLSNAFTDLGNGTYLAASPLTVRLREGDAVTGHSVLVARSVDRGDTWQVVGRLPQTEVVEVALFAFGGRVYMFIGPRTQAGIIRVMVSKDNGSSWSEPTEVVHTKPAGVNASQSGSTGTADPVETAARSEAWYCLHQTTMVVHEGKLYFAVSERLQRLRIVSCELQGILDPACWRISEPAEMPLPKELNPGLFPGPSMRCLEGNVVRVNGRLSVLARAVIDRQGTASIAAVFDAQDTGKTLKLEFSQFYAIPGGQCKFYIIHDAVSKLYWMASNLPVDSQKRAAPETPEIFRHHDRRFLMLFYSADSLNWFPAGCIVRTNNPRQSFMYPSLIIDGNDLAVLSRTARESGRAHDADLMTFHRVKNFREYAMDLTMT